jgi:hypothetical protein
MRPYTRAPNPTGKNPEWVVPQAVAALLNGKGNNIGDVTLTANSATTTLLNPLITPSSHISFSPLTLNAAAAIAGLYVSARAAGTATLTHANNAQTDRHFTYTVDG